MNTNLSPNMEMYLKTILQLEDEGEPVRVKPIATALGVTMPSVSQALRSLREKGLILHPAYGTVRLSGLGRRTARSVHDRYEVLKRFFTRVLHVDERVASREACRIEHELGSDTHRRLKAFLDFTQSRPDADRIIEHFHEYLEQHLAEPFFGAKD